MKDPHPHAGNPFACKQMFALTRNLHGHTV